jgi:hypothetical protein
MSFPASPVLNEVFIAGGKAWKFDGTNWVIPQKASTLPWELVTGKPTYFPADWSSTVANIPNYFNAKVIVSDMPPTNAVEGTVWFDATNERQYTYQQGLWIDPTVGVRTRYISVDPDVINYIEAVEAADGEPLEQDVVTALEAFILGCKVDGIWDAIKSSCIFAGARTFAGSIIPLAGVTHTYVLNIGNIVTHYNRKTGMLFPRDGVSVNSNRGHTAESFTDRHIAAYVTAAGAGQIVGNSDSLYRGSFISAPSSVYLFGVAGNSNDWNFGAATPDIPNTTTGFLGASRGANSDAGTQTRLTPSSHYVYRGGGATYDRFFNASTGASSEPIKIGGFVNLGGYEGNKRVSFYSVGASLDLSKLDARVTKLMTTLSTVIP